MIGNPFEMVVLIVLIVTVGRIVGAKYGIVRRGRGRYAEDVLVSKAQPDADSARQREEIKMLKERIAVLERITTDANSTAALDREIEKLR